MRKFLLLVALAIGGTLYPANAQQIVDLPYLQCAVKNQLTPGESGRMQAANHTTFVRQSVEGGAKELGYCDIKIGRPNKNDYKKRGYYGEVEVGYSTGFDISNFSTPALAVVNGYKFNPYFMMGLGGGAYLADLHCFVQVYLHFKSEFMPASKVSPFLSLNCGIDNFTGIVFSPNLGARYRISRSSSVFASVGLQTFMVFAINFRVGFAF